MPYEYSVATGSYTKKPVFAVVSDGSSAVCVTPDGDVNVQQTKRLLRLAERSGTTPKTTREWIDLASTNAANLGFGPVRRGSSLADVTAALA